MADALIQDKWTYLPGTSSGARTAISGAVIIAVPGASTLRLQDSGGAYRVTGSNPLITSSALQNGIYAQTDAAGSFSMYLPQKGSSKPSTLPEPQWTILLPDGKMLSGAVPNVSGPLTLDDLITTYSWVWSQSVYVAPVTPGTLARGTIAFVAQTSNPVVFPPTAPFPSSAYQIYLTPSVDSGTGNVPQAGWSSKTTTGFVINVSGVFTGSVDWEAVL